MSGWAAPKLVQGGFRNFKVTYPEDFDLAEAILCAAFGGVKDCDFSWRTLTDLRT